MMETLIPAWVNGELAPVEKLSVHERGLKHLAVSVFVCKGDAILIQQRALEKYHTPGLWANTCCTHPNWGEDSLVCANRRLNEELGISGLDLKLQAQIEYRADVGNALIEHEVVDVFLAQAPADLHISPNPAEVMDYRWIPYSKLVDEVGKTPQSFTPWLRIYLEQHSQTIFGQRSQSA